MNEIEKLIEDSKAIVAVARKAGRDLTTVESAAIDANLKRVEMLKKSEQTTATVNAFFGRKHDDINTGGQLALTGRGAKALSDQIIAGIRTKANFPAAGVQITSDLLMPGIVEQSQPLPSILNALPVRTVPVSYTYLRQLPGTAGRDMNVAVVPAGTKKPVSTVGIESVSQTLSVLATLSSPCNEMDLRDNSNLGAFVTSQLIDGLRQEWEQQIVNGDGTAPNLRGLLNTSGILTQALVSDATATVRRAITTLQGSGMVPAFAVLDAATWELIETQANLSPAALGYRGIQVDSQTQRLFGLPVVLSNILPAKTGLVIAQDSVVVDTDGVLDVKWSDADGGFASNTLTARVETRIGLSVTRASGVVKIATAA